MSILLNKSDIDQLYDKESQNTKHKDMRQTTINDVTEHPTTLMLRIDLGRFVKDKRSTALFLIILSELWRSVEFVLATLYLQF